MYIRLYRFGSCGSGVRGLRISRVWGGGGEEGMFRVRVNDAKKRTRLGSGMLFCGRSILRAELGCPVSGVWVCGVRCRAT